MIEKQYIELINKDIDKIITPSEKQKLNNYLSENIDAKNYYYDLLLVSDYLNKLPDPEPAQDLNKRIINRIDFQKYSRKSNKIPALFTFLKLKSSPKLAYLFLGMLIGMFTFALVFNQNPFDKNDIRGTIGIENRIVNSIKEVKLIHKDLSGSIHLMNSGDSFWFDIVLDSPSSTELIFNYQDGVDFIDFSPNTLKLSKSYNSIKVNNSSGSQHYHLFFNKNINSVLLNFQIAQSGKILLEDKFSLN